ncbi:hypothetical protein JK167_13350 [Levilactobacillus brevis]|uniref:Uncharacterized protein n=1 Tax=Levilactobacillus brevis TaxID=1580 RepID=A0AA41ERY7_LEVBR|nr:hypothetical protein [Levilactobacillus brevis]MBS0948598.1 hypothetical protein [Levilactobacillus brevis]MBS0979066.1 hypothetical protein [Levilactobacillus brevis]MBS1011792.1 hypothetical protein [Levilactobacillus brevis]
MTRKNQDYSSLEFGITLDNRVSGTVICHGIMITESEGEWLPASIIDWQINIERGKSND